METLTELEQTRFQELESVIRSGLRTFFETGDALSEIRDSKLYRQSHQTFEAYCLEVWEISARRARQFISSARTVSHLKVVAQASGGTFVPPQNEAQARALNSVPLEDRAEVLNTAQQTGKLTARSITQAKGIRGRGASSHFYTNHEYYLSAMTDRELLLLLLYCLPSVPVTRLKESVDMVMCSLDLEGEIGDYKQSRKIRGRAA